MDTATSTIGPDLRSPAARALDVLIVGAGLSGVCAAYYLQARLKRYSYAILEARAAIGGTWDLFRYPGIRSDSDMHTLGYSFRPWLGAKSITDGASIAAYVRDTAAAYGIDRKITFGCRVVRAAWSSAAARWTVTAVLGPAQTEVTYTCRFLFMCSGYYDYEQGYLPDWPDTAAFRGRLVHPQFWPEGLDTAGKRVVVVGSGATAVTLVPALAETAAHVTMLQRSPTYIVSRPAVDAAAQWLYRNLPQRAAHALARWKNVLLTMYFYRLARRQPERVKAGMLALVRKQLGPDHDIATHFTPRYNPWDQRLCLVPDGDLFATIRAGRASVVTDTIERFTADGLRLGSGRDLAADVIVTATGLKLKLLGGVAIEVDGAPVDLSRTVNYKGMMFSDVPNLALALGYTNASWTLKCELTARYVCRLLAHMQARGYDRCTPRRPAEGVEESPLLGLTSGYITRAAGMLPRQGAKAPWRLHQNYAMDMAALRFGALRDGVMEFSRAHQTARAA
jgi:cation diffusion facilitator CzcD-associated flavoprotein CzcO